MKMGVLGGTGPAGRGIAARLAAAGHDGVVGSRDRERARSVVDALREQWGERDAGLEKRGRHFRPVVPQEGSLTAAVQAAAPDAHVVAALQHVPAAVFGYLAH